MFDYIRAAIEFEQAELAFRLKATEGAWQAAALRDADSRNIGSKDRWSRRSLQADLPGSRSNLER